MFKQLTAMMLIVFLFGALAAPTIALAPQEPEANQEEEPPKPKAKLSDSDKSEFQKLFDKWMELQRSPKKRDVRILKKLQDAEQSLLDAIAEYEKEKKVCSTISDDQAWRDIFAENIKLRRSKAKSPSKGSIKKETLDLDIAGEKIGYEFAYSIPRGYKGKDKYPVIISFHDKGSNGYDYLRKIWDDDKTSKDLRNEFIFIAPTLGDKTKSGKGYTAKRYEWFDGYHARAMLMPVRWALENLHCDTDRIYVEGVGEGAKVALDLAALYGGNLFAGVVARQGQPRDLTLLPGLTHTPTLFLYREGGAVDSGDAKSFWNDMKTVCEREGIQSFQYKTKPKLAKTNPRVMGGQKTEPMKESNAEVIEFFKAQKADPYPSKIRFVTNKTHFKRCGYLQLNKVDIEGTATADCALEIDKETNTVKMTGSNFYGYTLFLTDSVLDLSKPIEVIINGIRAERKKVERQVSYMLDGMRKNPHQSSRITTAYLTGDVPQPEAPTDDK